MLLGVYRGTRNTSPAYYAFIVYLINVFTTNCTNQISKQYQGWPRGKEERAEAATDRCQRKHIRYSTVVFMETLPFTYTHTPLLSYLLYTGTH